MPPPPRRRGPTSASRSARDPKQLSSSITDSPLFGSDDDDYTESPPAVAWADGDYTALGRRRAFNTSQTPNPRGSIGAGAGAGAVPATPPSSPTDTGVSYGAARGNDLLFDSEPPGWRARVGTVNGPDNGLMGFQVLGLEDRSYMDDQDDLFSHMLGAYGLRDADPEMQLAPLVESLAAARPHRRRYWPTLEDLMTDEMMMEGEEGEEDAEQDGNGAEPALVPLLTDEGVRYRNPARQNDPLLRTVPRGRRLDLSDRASETNEPPYRKVGVFWWKKRMYYIDLKHRIYLSLPAGCHISGGEEEPGSWSERLISDSWRSYLRTLSTKRPWTRTEPPATSSSDKQTLPVAPRIFNPIDKRGIPKQSSPLKNVTTATYSPYSNPSKSPSSKWSEDFDKSTDYIDSSSHPFEWLAPTADISWRHMKRMVKQARRELNSSQNRITMEQVSHSGGAQPSSESMGRVQRVLEDLWTRASLKRKQEEPEEGRLERNNNRNDPRSTPPPSPSDACASSVHPAARRRASERTSSGGQTNQSSSWRRQRMASTKDDRRPAPVEITQPQLLSVFQSIEADDPSEQDPPSLSSPAASSRPSTRDHISTSQPPAAERFPGFCVRTDQEPWDEPRVTWLEANYPKKHAEYLNATVEILNSREWFADEHLLACIRLAMQRPSSSSSSPSSSTTRPRTFCFTFVLSALLHKSSVEIGHEWPAELEAFRAADLRIIPAETTPLSAADIKDLATREWTDATPSAGTHFSLAIESNGTLYYFDVLGRTPKAKVRRQNGKRLLGWYKRIRAAAGVTGRLALRVVDVEPQQGGWACGLLSVELVRKTMQDHDGDVSAVKDWGPETQDEIADKWQRAVVQELGGLYRHQYHHRNHHHLPPAPSSSGESDNQSLELQDSALVVPAPRQASSRGTVPGAKRSRPDVDAGEGETRPKRKSRRKR